MVGAAAPPAICLCGLADGADGAVGRLARECRCIFLAAQCPVDSARDEPTLSSVRRILADPSCAQPPTTLNATLLGLPSLFLSLAARKGSAAAKYLATAMESFGAENLVKAHATAAVPSPSTAAFA